MRKSINESYVNTSHQQGGSHTSGGERSGQVHTGRSHAMTPTIDSGRDDGRRRHHEHENDFEHEHKRVRWNDYDYPYTGIRYYPYYEQPISSPFWTTIQNVIINYPIYPSEIDKENMKRFISTLPIITPCYTDSCKAFIKDYVNFINIDDIVLNRQSIGNFLEKFRIELNNRFPGELNYYKIY